MKTIITLALAFSVSAAIAQTNNEAQRTAGNPIGGIIVKGGHNGIAAKETNPLYSADGNTAVNPMAKTTGGPVGGIIVKGGSNIPATDVKPNSPVYEPETATTDNPLYKGADRVAGSPIGGIVVKGGQNPTRFEISNPIPSIGVVVKHNIANRMITYTNDEPINDATLFTSLGVTRLTIKKGVYPIDNNGRVILQIEKIIHRDIAARTLQLQGYDTQTQTSFDYTVEPVIANGEINQIIITYKSINEKGVK